MRMPVELVAEALRQASDEGLASPLATVRMETGGLIADGELDPVAASLLQVVTAASLMVAVEVQLGGDNSLSTVWATPSRAVVTSTLDPLLVDIEPVRLGRLPDKLAELILLEPPRSVAERPIRLPTALLADADSNRHDPAAFRRRLIAGGVAEADAGRLWAFEAPTTRRWRISSTWTTPDGQQRAELRGLDAGSEGQWLIEMMGRPDAGGQMFFVPQDDGQMLSALRGVLPRRWVGTALDIQPADAIQGIGT
jgi:hypothetical protein